MPEIHPAYNDSFLIGSLKKRLSDINGTDVFTRDDVADLLAAHERLVRRFDRVVKISDSYQFELKDTARALQEALAKVRMLSGLIPICASCKKVRSVDGYWKQIEQYIIENSEADISHGLCPECAANYMQMAKKKDPEPVSERKLPRNLNEIDLEHPVVSQYLSIINNRHFFDSPLYNDLVRLLEKYIQLERRLQRIARISDKYQTELHEIRTRFEQDAKLDYLTGLSNRREICRLMELEISRIDRHGGKFGIILFDFDKFKNINDIYGHEAGDIVLQQAARLFEKELRSEDVLGRWGGEEFLVFQPNGDPGGVIRCAERLRRILAEALFPFGSDKIRVTISLGISMYCRGDRLTECINRADRSLYLAKKEGRNQIGPLEPDDC